MSKNHLSFRDPYAARESKRYQEPVPSRESVVTLLEDSKKPLSFSDMTQRMQVAASGEQGLERRLAAMVRDGQLFKNRRGYYALSKNMQLMRAKVRLHKNGAMFLVVEEASEGEYEDLPLDPRQSKGLMQDDTVLIRLVGSKKEGYGTVILVDILQRGCTHLVGRYKLHRGHAYLETTNRLYKGTILLEQGALDAQLEENDYVLARITSYPERHQAMLAVVEKVLGDHTKAGLERELVVHTFNLPEQFSAEATEQARELERVGVEIDATRSDWRHIPFVTIDGEDARDFDDAVFVKAESKGWTVMVAIADVSHYVEEGSALDHEARLRATSVYLPGSVIPMLPEVLSNDLCSLRPHEDRLVLGVTLKLDQSLNVKETTFSKAVIHSHARLTYVQATAMLNDTSLHPELQPHLQDAHTLYTELHALRLRRGALEIDLPQPKVVFNNERKIETFVLEERTTSHRMIEELMLLANENAALFMQEHGIFGMYRNHKKADATRLENLRPLLESYGLHKGGRLQAGSLQKILLELGKLEQKSMLIPLVLSTMSQADYAAYSIGHFGLAYRHYTHFTSPIRRYPDLCVHRAISQHLARKLAQRSQRGQLTDIAKHASMAERRADEASRYALNWLKCDFMVTRIGQKFWGNIASVRSFGIFVTLEGLPIDGLVHVSQLSNDYYDYDPELMQLQGRTSGKKYTVGMRVAVEVASVDQVENLIDFKLITYANNED